MPSLAEAGSWKAQLALRFASENGRTVLAERSQEGPLVVQKMLYPEGPGVCHAIVVHPPGGIAGGDELSLEVKAEGHALLTTPGAAKWYRSVGSWARQKLSFEVSGTLEWLPRETIVFDGALAALDCEVRLGNGARYIGWDVVCLGRTGSGERFESGQMKIDTRIYRDDKLLWLERGAIFGGGALLASPVGLGGRTVFGSFLATGVPLGLAAESRKHSVVTQVADLLVGRYLGDSTEQAFRQFTNLWRVLRPAVAGREAVAPRIWST